jgi:WD40 repeat protein
VFDPTSADPPEVREHHTAGVVGLAFGPDGALWTGAEDRRVCAAIPGTTELRDELRGCPNPVVRLAVSPDGSEVVAVTFDLISVAGCLHRFEVGGISREVWRFAGGERLGLVAAIAPDGSRVALLDAKLGPVEDFRFVIRDVRTGSERRAEKPGPWLPGVFRPDGGLVVYDSPKSLQIIDASGRRVRELALPTEGAGFEMPAIDCTSDGTVAVAALGLSGSIPLPGKLSTQGVPRLRLATWDAASGRPGQTIDLDLTPVLPSGVSVNVMPLGCAASPDGRRAVASALLIIHGSGPAIARLQGVVAVWDLASGAEVFRRVSDEPARFVGFDPAGRLVTAGGSAAGGELTCWDLATRAEVLRLRGHARPILAAAFGPDGRIVTAGADRVVKVWDAATGRELLTLDGFAREVTHVRFTTDGRDLVAGTGIDVLMVRSTDAGTREQVWAPGEVRVFRGGR